MKRIMGSDMRGMRLNVKIPMGWMDDVKSVEERGMSVE